MKKAFFKGAFLVLATASSVFADGGIVYNFDGGIVYNFDGGIVYNLVAIAGGIVYI